MVKSIMNTTGEVIIDVNIADLWLRIEREDSQHYWLSARDTSKLNENVNGIDFCREKSVRLTPKQIGQVLALICDGDDTDPNLYDGLEDIFGPAKWPYNLRPIP